MAPVSPPNEKANLPGPLQRMHAAQNRNAAPVKFSDLFGGGILPTSRRSRNRGLLFSPADFTFRQRLLQRGNTGLRHPRAL